MKNDIAEIQAQIAKVEADIETASTNAKEWLDKGDDKKWELFTQEKTALLQEKTALLQEKHDLRQEKTALLQKEQASPSHFSSFVQFLPNFIGKLFGVQIGRI